MSGSGDRAPKLPCSREPTLFLYGEGHDAAPSPVRTIRRPTGSKIWKAKVGNRKWRWLPETPAGSESTARVEMEASRNLSHAIRSPLTQGGSPVRENRTPGSVRGAARKGRPYRECAQHGRDQEVKVLRGTWS